jgi:4-oxalomesaconate tautomerase
MPQHAIPFMQIRGGSSKGVFFNAKDLPTDETERNRVVLAAMEGVGPGDPRQIDGLGGADSLTAKVAIVSPSDRPDADLDYLFLQVLIGKGQLSASQTCGNILAGVLPFALESGMLPAQAPATTATVHMLNGGGLCEVRVQTPGGEIAVAGNAKVDGVPGTGAPIVCNYLNIAGASCGALLPTGNACDLVDGIEATCVDNGMPVILLRARDLGISGQESKAELDNHEPLKKRIESIRLYLGEKMNLGDVRNKSVPKICLLSPAENGGFVSTRMFIPHVCHAAIGVLAAVSVATGCLVPGSVAAGICSKTDDFSNLSIEHPTGELTVSMQTDSGEKGLRVLKAGAVRTARIISKGEVYVPATFSL